MVSRAWFRVFPVAVLLGWLAACASPSGGVERTGPCPAGCAKLDGILVGVRFAPGDHRLDGQAREALQGVVRELKTNPDVIIEVDGHTDNRGRASENLELSKQRVLSVVRFLVAQGISSGRLKPYGHGESKPLQSNATPEGRERNRRIELKVLNPAA